MRHFVPTMGLAGLLFLGGCAGPSSFSSQGDAFGDGTKRNLNASQDGFFTKSFKQAGAALTPKPKVVKAADPTLLSTKPGAMGPDLHLTAARQYESQGQVIKAEEHYRKALEIAPQNINAQLSYARLLHREGKFPAAEQVYQRLLTANPNLAVAHNDLGLCLARHGQLEVARMALSKAVQLKPESKLYRNNLATVLVEANRIDEAFEHLLAAHGEAGANYNLGLLVQRQGQSELAAQMFARASRLDPSLPVPAENVQVAQRPESVRVAPVANTQPAGNTYYVGDANAQAAPYRLPGQAGQQSGAAFDRAANADGDFQPQSLPEVHVAP